MIALVDYGAGNVGSVLKAVEYLGFPAEVAGTAGQLDRADKIILPGQTSDLTSVMLFNQR